MEKNLEKSLKRYLKRKIKITMALVVSFLITGVISFAGEDKDVKNTDKKKNIFLVEMLSEKLNSLLRDITIGNIHIIEEDEVYKKTQEIDGEKIKIGINNGRIEAISYGQEIVNGIGINNEEIISRNYGQNIENGIGINNGTIDTERYGQYINGDNSIGINNGTIISEDDGQYISSSGSDLLLAINNGMIDVDGNGQGFYNGMVINTGVINATENGQYSSSSGQLAINTGTINSKEYGQGNVFGELIINIGEINSEDIGQHLNLGQLAINTGIIKSKDNGQYVNGKAVINNGIIDCSSEKNDYGQEIISGGNVGINNGVVIANNPYRNISYKNGIALKRDENKNLILNDGRDSSGKYNENVDILGKTELGNNTFSDLITNDTISKKDVAQGFFENKIQGYNIFINNLGTDDNTKNNQLILDKNLTDVSDTEKFSNTHITTAVTENGYENDKAVVKVSEDLESFSMDKSTIVGYFEKNGTLIGVGKAKDITLDNSTISAFTGEKNGTTPTDVKAIKFVAGSNVSLNNSTVNGKMDFESGGDNTLNLGAKYYGKYERDKTTYTDGTQFMTDVSDVSFGDGSDTININIQKGNVDNENITEKGFVSLGKVDFGAGDDTLKFSFEDYKSGNFIISGEKITETDEAGKITIKESYGIDFGEGNNDKIEFSDTLNMEEYTEVDGETKTTEGAIEKNIIMLNNLLNNKSIPITGLENLKLADKDENGKGNTFYFEKDSISFEFAGKVLGGNGDDTFIIGENTLGASIDGGEGESGDTLKVDTNITAQQLSNKKGIENLELGLNAKTPIDYTIDFTYKDQNDASKNLEDFKNIKSGAGSDNFTVSSDKIGNMTIDGGIGIDENDILTISGVLNNTKENTKDILKGITNIEELKLDDVENILSLDNINDSAEKGFKNISGGNKNDTFKISVDKLGNFEDVKGGDGEDTFEIEDKLSDGKEEHFANYKEFETLKLNGSENSFTLNGTNANGDNFQNIQFVENSTGNNLTLADDLEKKTVTFKTSDNNTVNVDSKVENEFKTFNHIIENAEEVKLTGENSEWKFASDSKIKGTTTLDLGEKNTLDLTQNDGAIIGMTGDNLVINGNENIFDGVVTLKNGEIKIGLDSFVKLQTGKEFGILDGDNLKVDNSIISSYAFVNIDDKKLTVKTFEELSEDSGKEYKAFYNGTYENLVNNYYNNGVEDDKYITNAFNSFNGGSIVEAVQNFAKDRELIFLSSKDNVTDSLMVKKVFVGTENNGDTNLSFDSSLSTNDFVVEVKDANENKITFNDVVTIENTLNGENSKSSFDLIFNGKINIENGIKFGESGGTVTIDNTENITNLGTISGATNDKISLSVNKVEKEDGFGKLVLASYDSDKNLTVGEINVARENEFLIKDDYTGTLNFTSGKNNIEVSTDYTGDINFASGENKFTVSKDKTFANTVSFQEKGNEITVDGKLASLEFGENIGENIIEVNGTLTNLGLKGNSNGNNITVNGRLESNINFGADSRENSLTINEGGAVGKNITFGSGKDDIFILSSKDEKFGYNIINADTINLNGKNKAWSFSDGAKITGTDVTLNINDKGTIKFDVKAEDNKLTAVKNSVFGDGNYTINGNVKIAFDDSVRFDSLNDTLTGDGNISLGEDSSLIIPEFLKLTDDKKELKIKSAESLKDLGLKEHAFGNYEYAVLNYNNKDGKYNGLTSMMNNNSIENIVLALNNGFDVKDYYFYSDDRTLGNIVQDKITLGDLYIKTSEDNEVKGEDLNTDIKFTNVTGGIVNIDFAEGTTNKVSFLEGTNISKIDGSQSKAGFELNLNGINFSGENKEVTMSGYDDSLNILSSISDLKVDAGAGDDKVNILSSINGLLDGNSGDNTLNIGEKVQTLTDDKPNELIISGTVKNFGEINIYQDTKLDSSLKFAVKNNSDTTIHTETEEIKLNGNNLTLGVDYTDMENNTTTKHALYDSGIKIDANTGTITVETAEAGNNTIISLGENNRSEILNGNKENMFASDSSVHNVQMAENGDILVKLNDHIMGDETSIEYAHLDKIYQSIKEAGKIPLMSKTTTLSDKTKDESIKAQLEYYGKIYHSTPYAYANKISKKSMELITDSLVLNDGMPDLKVWRFGGSIAGREAESDYNFYGNNYYNGIDVGNKNVTAEANIYGAYAFGEYGFQENKAIGFVIAGSKSDTDIDSSNLKGNNIFVSAYVKQNIENLSMIAGIGYQRGFYDAERVASNDFQSEKFEKDFEDDAFVGYVGAKYRYDFGNNFYLEPKAELRVTHSILDDIAEESGEKLLSIKVDGKDFTSVDGELGLDIGKRFAMENGIFNLKAGVSVDYALSGYGEEYLDARITGSNKDFEIISPEDEDRYKVNLILKGEYESNNGIYYDVHYKTTTDNDDYSVGFGVGYRF